MSEYVRAAKRRSWHVVRNWTRVTGRAVALCGRTVWSVELQTDAPALDERGCEPCARLALRNEETLR